MPSSSSFSFDSGRSAGRKGITSKMRSTGHQFLLLLAIHSGAFFFTCVSLPHQEVSALMALKRDIFEDPLAALADWDSLNGEPCSWFGVVCSVAQNHVVSLNLSGLSLKGFLAPEVAQLSSLKEIILKDNLFSGTIPKQIGLLKNLTVLDLSMNKLSGLIPAELGNLTSITKFYLHYNGLIGSIPPELFKLLHLFELRLDRNRLVGPILGNTSTDFTAQVNSMSKSHSNGNETHFCHFPRLKLGVFSYNFFVGKIPSCLKYLPRSSFKGNCLQDEYAISQRTSQICSTSYPSYNASYESYLFAELILRGIYFQDEFALSQQTTQTASCLLLYRKCIDTLVLNWVKIASIPAFFLHSLYATVDCLHTTSLCVSRLQLWLLGVERISPLATLSRKPSLRYLAPELQ